MAATAIIIEFLFQALHLIPAERHAKLVEAAIRWNYTTVLNLVFAAVASLLIWRFFTTGGPQMVAGMDAPRSGAHSGHGLPASQAGPSSGFPRNIVYNDCPSALRVE